MQLTRVQDLKNLSGIVIAVGIVGLLGVSWAAKAGYNYLDKHWLSLRCSVLREQYYQTQLEYAERERLEEAGLIERLPHTAPTYFPGATLKQPTYEEYKEQQRKDIEIYADIHRRNQRMKECGVGIFSPTNSQ